MKRTTILAALACASALQVLGSVANKPLLGDEKSPVVIYIVDPKDPDAKLLAVPDELEESKDHALQAFEPKTLDDLLFRLDKGGPALSIRQQRIVKRILSEQKEFIALLDKFLKAKFDPADDGAEKDFIKIRERVSELTFDAATEKDYYERLYLINNLWLDHRDETARFNSLDRNLQDYWMKIEDKRRRTRQIISGVGTVVGAVMGGVLSAKKIWPVVTDGKGLTFLQGLGRTGAILTGATVGAVVGGFAGYLGSYVLSRAERIYTDPIDGSEDLIEILDIVDQMP